MMIYRSIVFLVIIGMICCSPKPEEAASEQSSEIVSESEEVPQSTHPVWSPDGQRIAFINNKTGVSNNNAINFEVFTTNADGSNILQHTHNTAFESEIAWSPDGNALSFKSYRDGNDEIYILDLISGEEKNITKSPRREGSPEWSKDGSLIYFQSDRDIESGELYSYNVRTEVILRLTDNDFNEIGATWSPDGLRIAFTSNQDGDDDIYIMDVSGDNLIQVTNNELMDWSPRWSPDARKILFTYGDWNTEIFELRLIDLELKTEETILKEVDSGNATWNPSGTKIAFGSPKSGSGEIYILNMSTKTEIKITSNDNF